MKSLLGFIVVLFLTAIIMGMAGFVTFALFILLGAANFATFLISVVVGVAVGCAALYHSYSH